MKTIKEHDKVKIIKRKMVVEVTSKFYKFIMGSETVLSKSSVFKKSIDETWRFGNILNSLRRTKHFQI